MLNSRLFAAGLVVTIIAAAGAANADDGASPQHDSHASSMRTLTGMRGYPEGKKEHDASFFPFIDRFGQYMHKDWPGKTHSVDELHERRDAEVKDLAAHPAPADWDRFGGWGAGPKLEAKGYFYVTKHAGKWWFVDPDGHLFFSQGIDHVTAEANTPISPRAGWFADPPFDDPRFKRLITTTSNIVHGDYQGMTVRCFDFGEANAMLKYGDDWRQQFAMRSHERFRSWAINTMGNWSERRICAMDRTVYVGTISVGGGWIKGSKGYWRPFPDPFDPQWQRELHERVRREAKASGSDPWCLGWFVDNEMAWGNDTSLAIATLRSPADQPAKHKFLSLLSNQYGTVEKLNAKWGTHYASWDALLMSTDTPDVKKAGDDLRAFYTVIAEAYFRECRDAIRVAAPHRLYLGCRFSNDNSLAEKAAAKYCDVISYNRYWTADRLARFQCGAGDDVPVMIGEFHFGALDRGMFHPGLVKTKDQADRVKHYADYVRAALANPQFVGVHWFKYKDEAPTGRPLDGENYQIGFTDVADTPYPEIVEAARQVGASMYAYRARGR